MLILDDERNREFFYYFSSRSYVFERHMYVKTFGVPLPICC